METTHEKIRLTNQDLRDLETEKKELTAEYEAMSSDKTEILDFIEREKFRNKFAQTCRRLNIIDDLILSKQADLKTLVDSLQLSLF